MARQEEINKAKNAFYNNMLRTGYLWAYDKSDCFEEGANWADANPKSPWISVEDDLPYKHKELISLDDKRDTKQVIAIANGTIVLSRMRMMSGNWYWENVEPAYWMPIPELPKNR